jgi:hypothetical protein
MSFFKTALSVAILMEIWEPGSIPEIYESQEQIELFAKQVYELILEPKGW